MSMSEISNSTILANPIREEQDGEEDNDTVPRGMEISNIPEDEEATAWPTSSPLGDIAEGSDHNSRHSMGVPRRGSTSQRSMTGTIVESPNDKNSKSRNQPRRPSISAAIGSMFKKKSSTGSAESSPKKRTPSVDNLELPMSVSTANFFRESDARNSNDAFQLFSNAVLKNIEPTSLNVTWKGTTSVIKTLLDRTAADLVMDIIVHLQLEKKGINPSGYRIAKIDHQNPGTFMWLVPHHESAIYNLRHGDDLLLKYIAELDEITVEIPQFKAKKIIDIAWEDLTENIIDRIKTMYSIESSVVCGLYVPRLGMWLNVKKPILTYDLRSNALQFRPMMDEFPVRINLADFDQKFAIKVLPSFKIADIISIVGYQINNRKLQLPPNRKYGLFLDDAVGWMEENNEMSSYPTAKTQFLTFKVQERLAQFKFDNQDYELYFNATATVENLLESVLPDPQKRAQYTLYNCFDEGYATTKTVWDTLADPSADLLRVERKLIPVDIKCSRYADANVEFLLNPEKPLEQYFDKFSRKFGLTVDEIVRVTKEGERRRGESVSFGVENINFDSVKPKSEAGLEVYACGVPKMQLVGDIKFISAKPCLYLVTSRREKPEPIPKSLESDTKFTVEKLVSMIVDGDQLEKHPNFTTAFLMTYSTFTNPQEILQELQKLYVVRNDQVLDWEPFQQLRRPIQLRICNFILHWTKKFAYDFSGPDGNTKIRLLLDFAEHYVSLDSLNLAKQIRKQLNKMKEQDNRRPGLSNTARDFETWSAEAIMAHPVEKIAEQLTLIDYDIFLHVMPYEILRQAWTKSDADVKAPGIVALSKRFNSVANFVVESILAPKTSKLRGERICKIIDLGYALYKLNNFSTLMAVIAGLNKAAITRLKISFKDVPSKQIQKKEEMEAVMAPMGSYKRYRQEIQTAQPPCVPYIGTTLTDLTYTDDGNPDMIDGFINFEKRKQTSKLISELLYYQQTQYQITVKGDLHTLLTNLPEASATRESENWKLSKSLE